MDNNIRAFWQTSWFVFKSGVLNNLSPAYQKAANKPFEEYLKTDLDVNNAGISAFLRQYPPKIKEFLLGYDAREMHFVLTNQRLWLYDKQAKIHIEIDLKQIKDFKSSTGWSAKISINLKDGKNISPSKLNFIPKDIFLKEAVSRVDKEDGWGKLPDFTSHDDKSTRKQSSYKTDQTTDASMYIQSAGSEKDKEIYNYRSSFKKRRLIRFLISFLAPFAFFIIGFWGVSHGLQWKYPTFVMIIIPLFLIWFIIELFKLGKIYSFNVQIYNDKIVIGKRSIAWTEIERMEYLPGVELQPAIILVLRSGESLSIPAAIESTEYLNGVIEKRLSVRK